MGHGRPSDWVDERGGSSWGKIILLSGAGCLVLVLALAALSTFGTCAGVNSCCGRIEQQHAALARPAQDLLDAVGSGDNQRAYLGLSDQYRDAHTQREFDEFIGEHGTLFRGGSARVAGSRSVSRNGTRKTFLTVLILDPAKKTKGSVTFRIRQTGKTNEQGDPIPEIDEIYVGEPDELREEKDISAAVQTHLRRMGAKDYEGAWEQMDPEFTSKTDMATFQSYVESQDDLFGPTMRARVRKIDSDGRNAQASVDLVDVREIRRAGRVIYRLTRAEDGVWRIREMRTEVEEAAPTRVEPDNDAG
jgi:hypothetical protein